MDGNRLTVLQNWISETLTESTKADQFVTKYMLFVDPNSSSGFFVPMKTLGLMSRTSPYLAVNCSGEHQKSVARFNKSLKPIIIATALIDLTQQEIDEFNRRGDIIIRIPYDIPQGPVCIRADIVGDPKEILKKYLKYEDIRPVDTSQEMAYRELFENYVLDALDKFGNDRYTYRETSE